MSNNTQAIVVTALGLLTSLSIAILLYTTATDKTHTIHVIDGDTVWTEEHGKVRIRDIDAYELGTRCGKEAQDLAANAMDYKRLEVLDTGEKGYYGRIIGDVMLINGQWYSEYAVQHPCVKRY